MNIEALSELELRNIKVNYTSNIPSYSNYRRIRQQVTSVPMTGEAATLKEPKQYTGDKMLGIATLHKSNAVPVFSKEEAEDISNMRR